MRRSFSCRRVLACALLYACHEPAPAANSGDDAQRKPSAHDEAKTADGHHRDEPEHEALPTRVRLDPQVVRDAHVQTSAVTREALAATIDLPGEVSFDPDKAAHVSALVSGRIVSLSFKEGQTVREGELLATLRVPELGKAHAAFTATAAKAVAARANADRLQALAAQRLAARQELLAAQAEANALEAEAEAANTQLQALGMSHSEAASGKHNAGSLLTLRAPLSGDVVARDAVVGQMVGPEHVLATIADLREVWFLGRVFEKNLGQIKVGANVEIQLNAYPNEKFLGTVEYIGKQVDPSARTVTARVRLQNRGDLLRIGLFGVARVDIGALTPGKQATGIVISRSAVTQIGHQSVVFVQQPDGDFDVHAVVLGEGALGKVQVLNGLREGEQIVTRGVFTIKSAVLKSTFAEEE
jgi:cobalt-zinc-cadmium efflux system membrane fusion protein